MQFEEVTTVELPAPAERVLVQRKSDRKLTFARLVRRWGTEQSHWIDDESMPIIGGVECWYKQVSGDATP